MLNYINASLLDTYDNCKTEKNVFVVQYLRKINITIEALKKNTAFQFPK